MSRVLSFYILLRILEINCKIKGKNPSDFIELFYISLTYAVPDTIKQEKGRFEDIIITVKEESEMA